MAPPDRREPRGRLSDRGRKARIKAALDRLEEVLRANPAIVDRTRAYLAGELPGVSGDRENERP